MTTTEAVVAITIVALTAGIPLMGVTLRIALRPIIEAYARVREAHSRVDQFELAELRARVTALETELRALEPGRRAA